MVGDKEVKFTTGFNETILANIGDYSFTSDMIKLFQSMTPALFSKILKRMDKQI